MNEIIIPKDETEFLRYTNLIGEASYVDFMEMLFDIWYNEPDFVYLEEEAMNPKVVAQIKNVPTVFLLVLIAMYFYPELHFHYSKNVKETCFHETILEDIKDVGEEDALENHLNIMRDILSQNTGGAPGGFGATSYDGTEIDMAMDIIKLLKQYNYTYFVDDLREGTFAGDTAELNIVRLYNAPIVQVW